MGMIERITKSASNKMHSIKEGTWNKIEDINDQMGYQTQYRFLQAIMKDEKVDYNTALEMCTPHSEQWQPKYSLGYKMAIPYKMIMIRSEKGKRQFKKELLPEELALFESEVEKMNIKKEMREERKRQKRRGVGLER